MPAQVVTPARVGPAALAARVATAVSAASAATAVKARSGRDAAAKAAPAGAGGAAGPGGPGGNGGNGGNPGSAGNGGNGGNGGNAIGGNAYTTSGLNVSAGPFVGYTPAQILQAYGLTNIGLNGAGRTIAIVDDGNDQNLFNDVKAFDNQFGLQQFGGTGPIFQVYNQNGNAIALANSSPMNGAPNVPAAAAEVVRRRRP